MPVAYNADTGEGMYLGQDNTWQKAKVAKNPSGEVRIYDGSEWQPIKKTEPANDLSLIKGIEETAKTAGKSVLGVPATFYEEIRHPIDSMKTLYQGAKNIPENMYAHAKGNISSVREDIEQLKKIPDPYQKFLRGGRAALTTAASPLDVLVGAPYESTFGQLAEKGTGGRITAQEASFLPMIIAGKTSMPEAIRMTDKYLAKQKFEVPRVENEATKAARIVKERLEQSQKAGGLLPQEAVKKIQEAKKSGKPMTLADIGGENVRALGGYVARQPGVARDVAKNFLEKRDTGAAARLTQDLDKNLSTGSLKKTAEFLAEERSRKGKPLFDEAYRGGSLAPLEKQYENEFHNAASTVDKTSKEIKSLMAELPKLKEKLAKTSDSISKRELQDKISDTERQLLEKEGILKQAADDKEMTLEHLRTAQDDKARNAPGAIWSPKIQRLLTNSNVKKGLSKGYGIEKNLADAEGKKFDPNEYAIVGEKDGEPIVGKVPNMKLLATAKEGLDSVLAEDAMRDPLTGGLNKEGRSIAKLRDALVSELDRLNPKYKAARDVWAGDSASMQSLKYGRNVFLEKPEDIEAEVNKMSEAEKDFARLGAADMIREKILKTGLGGDEAKSILKNEWTKMQLRPLFKSGKEFNSFIDAVASEREMFETKYDVLKNSATQKRAAEDQANNMGLALQGGKGAFDFLSGRYWSSLNTLMNIKRDLGLRQNPKLNEAIAKLIFEPDITYESLGIKNVQ